MSQQDTTAGTTPASMTMTPDSGPQAGGTPVTITNGRFSGVPQLFFAGVPATDVKVEAGGTTLTAVTPAGAAAGPAEVTVTTSTVPVKVGMFDYIAPAVTGVSPAEGPLAGGTPVTISGNGFAGAEQVQFGGVPATPFTVSADGNSITTTSPAGASAGAVDVRVSLPSGLTAIVPADQFTYQYTAPAVTGVSPVQGPLGGGTPVTITGNGFAGAEQVQFGGVPAASFTVSADGTSITTTSPAGAKAAAVDVRVSLPSGLTPAVQADKFIYLEPVITGLSVSSGPLTGGTPLTIFGAGLAGALQVQFGGIPAASFTVSADGSTITTVSPAGPKVETVDVQVSLPTGLTAKTTVDQFSYYTPAPVNALFVIDNRTGVPDDQVFVKFLGAQIGDSTLTQTYGDNQPLDIGTDTADRSYSLTQMTTTLADVPGLATPVPAFRLNDYAGGRIYFSLGVPLQSTTIPAAQNPSDPDFGTVYAYVEPSIFTSTVAGQTNIDASYVDFVAIPVDIAVLDRSTGALVNPPANNPLSSPAGTALFDALTSGSTAGTQVPAGAVVTATTSVPTPDGGTLAIGGTARILSPSMYDAGMITNAVPYHDWSALLDALQTAGTSLPVASYTTIDTGVVLPKGTLFGFAGSKSSSIAPAWTEKQDYTLAATVVADLNPGGANPRIKTLAGQPGIVITGSGATVGDFSVYLLRSDLEAQTGIYGANPPYTVDWQDAPAGPTAYPQAQIENDLGGRVVGDLLAGFNFGWAGCTTTVATQAAAITQAGGQPNLAGSVFDPPDGPLAQTAIGALSTGQLFYLLSLQPTTQALAQWLGASLRSSPDEYNTYASDFQALTNGYNMAFTDRLQGPSDPDMFFTPGDTTYVKITLSAGAYTVTITPPSG